MTDRPHPAVLTAVIYLLCIQLTAELLQLQLDDAISRCWRVPAPLPPRCLVRRELASRVRLSWLQPGRADPTRYWAHPWQRLSRPPEQLRLRWSPSLLREKIVTDQFGITSSIIDDTEHPMTSQVVFQSDKSCVRLYIDTINTGIVFPWEAYRIFWWRVIEHGYCWQTLRPGNGL